MHLAEQTTHLANDVTFPTEQSTDLANQKVSCETYRTLAMKRLNHKYAL